MDRRHRNLQLRAWLAGLLTVTAVACHKDPPPVSSVATTPDVPTPAPLPSAPTPETATEAPRPTPGELLMVALAAHTTSTVEALLADDVTLATATDDACHGGQACLEILGLVSRDVHIQVERVIHAGPTDVVQASALVHGQQVAFALLVESTGSRVTAVRYVGSTLPWRFLPRAPVVPLAQMPTPTTETVRGPADPTAATRAAALGPVALAEDPTAHGLVEPDVRWHDAATGKSTVGAEDNRQALRAFLQHFAVVQADVTRTLSAGSWLVVERTLTLELRAPVVPVPPTSEPLRVRMVDVLRLTDGKVTEVWAYSDPFAFLPAVELPAIPTLH